MVVGSTQKGIRKMPERTLMDAIRSGDILSVPEVKESLLLVLSLVQDEGMGRTHLAEHAVLELLDMLRADDPICDECGQQFDDNPDKSICKTCEDWAVSE